MNRFQVEDSIDNKSYENNASLYNQKEFISNNRGYYDKNNGYYKSNEDIGYYGDVEMRGDEASDEYYRRKRLENDEVNSYIENTMNQRIYSWQSIDRVILEYGYIKFLFRPRENFLIV